MTQSLMAALRPHSGDDELNEAMVRYILTLPPDLMEGVVATTRERLIEEIIMDISLSCQHLMSSDTLQRVQNFLFQRYLNHPAR